MAVSRARPNRSVLLPEPKNGKMAGRDAVRASVDLGEHPLFECRIATQRQPSRRRASAADWFRAIAGKSDPGLKRGRASGGFLRLGKILELFFDDDLD